MNTFCCLGQNWDQLVKAETKGQRAEVSKLRPWSLHSQERGACAQHPWMAGTPASVLSLLGGSSLIEAC